MKTEKIVLSFIAALFGLIAAFVGFYFYQSTKVVQPSKSTLSAQVKPTALPTPNKSFFLTIDNPADESVQGTKTLTVSGKTTPDATVTILTPTDQQVVQPSSNGQFSVSTTIGDGANAVEITAIAPSGEEHKEMQTVTYSTESF